MDNLKHSIKRLEVEHLKLAKENELLRLQQQQSPTPQRNGYVINVTVTYTANMRELCHQCTTVNSSKIDVL